MATSRTEAPDAVSPPPGNPRFPLLDGLRAVAATFVLLFHVVLRAEPRNLGVIRDLSSEGVAIFFVLSGFLLYRPFIRSRLKGDGVPSIRDYARRRILRIVPAYWVALTFSVIVVGATAVTLSHLPIYYLLLQDYFDTTRYHGLSVAWTLSIEVTYYAVLPVLAYAAVVVGSRRHRRWRLLPELLIVGGFFLVALAYGVLQPSAPPLVFGYTDWFAGGMFLAVLTFPAGAHREMPRSFAVLLWVAAAALFVAVTRLPFGGYAGHLLLLGSAVAVVTPAVFPADGGLVSGFLRLPVVLWLGLVSYGLYLWHVPLIEAIDTVHTFSVVPLLLMTMLATVGVAAASYHLLEAPILRLKDRRAEQHPRLGDGQAGSAMRQSPVPASVRTQG